MVDELFHRNRNWARNRVLADAGFFRRLARLQAPRYLWIGCSDSRVPANEIVGLEPGEVFVHRNVANLVIHSDMNCLSVLQYAIDVLRVEHVIVCGHYGCGGVRAALDDATHGVIANWLRPIRELAEQYDADLAGLGDAARYDRLCELHVARQVANVGHSTVVADAWRRGQAVTLHGWIYGLEDGLLRDLGVSRGAPP